MPLTNDPSVTPVAESWDTYWRGTRDGAAYASEGANHPEFPAFWHRVLQTAGSAHKDTRMVDIACGNGAVEGCVYAAFQGALPELYCLDISEAAVGAAVRRFSGTRGIVADARAIPLRSREFMLVTSQFGIEYAGPGALPEAARLVAPGGRLALLMHYREGSIFRECSASLDAVETLLRAEFIPLALRMFEAAFAASGSPGRGAYEAAARRLLPGYRALEAVMQKHGQHVAADTALRLYNDVARIQRDMRAYDAKEVLDWLRRMEGELQAYAGRMASMCAAAIDRNAFDAACGELAGMGFELNRAEPLQVPGAPPLAWALVAERC